MVGSSRGGETSICMCINVYKYLNNIMEQKIKAYKGFDKDLSCRGFKYEVGKEYEETGDIKACEIGRASCRERV